MTKTKSDDVRRCGFYMPCKRRYCQMRAYLDRANCVQHLSSQDRLAHDLEVCKYNSQHIVKRSKLQQHFEKCPEKGLSKETIKLSASEKLPPLSTISDEVLVFLDKLRAIDEKLNLSTLIQEFPPSPFEPIINACLANSRHWPLSGFPGLLSTDKHVPAAAADDDDNEPSPVKIAKNDDTTITRPLSPPSNTLVDPLTCLQGSTRHLYQNACLVNLLASQGQLTTNRLYVEFGAGRGGLTHWVNVCLVGRDPEQRQTCLSDSRYLPQPVANTKFLLIDRQGVRNKLDNRYRDKENFHRIRSDIACVELNTLPFVNEHHDKSIIAIAKHLCGAGTDLALTCLANSDLIAGESETSNGDGGVADPCSNNRRRLDGILCATCCHDKCQWSNYAGRVWLEQEADIGEREFAILCRLSSWAVCGFRRNRKPVSTNDEVGEQEQFVKPFASLNFDQRREIGRLAKTLIDWGRLRFIQSRLGFNHRDETGVNLIQYTSRQVTPENRVLHAYRQTSPSASS